MNVPNKLTLSRLLLTAAFVVVMNFNFTLSKTLALILFSVAGLTDFFDGHIARRDNIITDFGVLMDPLADKILTCSAFILFAEFHGKTGMSAWMVGIIVARELGITGLRMLAASRNRILSAERLGKFKTISQIICIISILVKMAYPEWGAFGNFVFSYWVDEFSLIFIWIALILTVVSGVMYLWNNRDLYIHDV